MMVKHLMATRESLLNVCDDILCELDGMERRLARMRRSVEHHIASLEMENEK